MKTIKSFFVLGSQLFLWGLVAADSRPGFVIQWGGKLNEPHSPDPSNNTLTNVVMVNGQVLTNVVVICAGFSHALALRSDGTVLGWGNNNVGQATGIPTARFPGIGQGLVMTGGRVLSNITSIAAGGGIGLALRRDGTVVAWGGEDRHWGRPAAVIVPRDLSNIVAVAAGSFHSLALKRDGSVVWWGENARGEASPPEGLSNVVAISVGHLPAGNSLALKSDGTVVRWGFDPGVPEGLSNVVAISAGAQHCLALKRDGSVVAWGHNLYGETTVPAGLSNIVAISAGMYHSLALKQNGTVVAWGDNRFHQTDVPAGLTGAVAIAAGDAFSLAITTNSAVAETFRR